jgi:ligand-binding sensor domain-containing protein/HPt (histidine-containing phosphotransfer) domain-containing protein
MRTSADAEVNLLNKTRFYAIQLFKKLYSAFVFRGMKFFSECWRFCGNFSHKITSFIFLLLCILLSASSFAASIPAQISFQNILENKDITMGEGASFFQDSDGFMWLGGGTALIRYDGYEFREIFITDRDKPGEKEAVLYTQNIFQDSRQLLWVASRQGLLTYDPRTEKLTRIKNDASQPLNIATTNSLRTVELPTGEMFVSSVDGLFIVDPITHKYTTIVADAKKPDWLKSLRINDILLVGTDDIWLGTEEGLEKLHWQTKTFTLYKLNTAQPDSVPDNLVQDMAADGEGKFWLATANGVVHYDPVTHVAKRYVNIPNDQFSLGGNDVWNVLVDSQGVLWAASDDGGLSVFDKEKNRFINHKAEVNRVGSLNTDKVRALFEDRSGDIWVGNYPVGVHFFDRAAAPIVTYTNNLSNLNSLSYSRVLSVQEDKNGNLWLGTDGGGLNFFNREEKKFTHFKTDANDSATINGDAVLTTHIDSAGLIWTGTWGGGIASYDPMAKKFTRHPFGKQRKNTARVSTSTALNSAHVWSIYEDSQRELWIATHTGGVSKYNRHTKMFTHYTHVVDDAESLSGNLTWVLFEDSRHNFWVGASSGLNLMNRDQGTFKTFAANPDDPKALSNSSALTIYEDSKKRLWVGTDKGLNLFDYDTHSFTSFTKQHGFIDDCIRTILEDSNGNLWVGTNNGFASFNPETKKIKNYNRISGRLVGGFATHSGLVSSRGEIILGGTEGLRIFNAEELSENKKVPPLALTDFKVFSDSVVVGGPDNILKKTINHTDLVELDYTKSMFALGFSVLNFRDTAKNKYSYKLEGFDKDWLDAGNQRLAKYTNLNAGKYVFKVKGSNNDNVWNEEGRSVTIIQLPPPWKTWWAYTLYAFAILSLLGGFVFSQRRKRQLIEEQNKLLELKVNERTAEVREKSKDIETMLSNIPQGLFTVQADGTIHSEYSQFLEVIFDAQDIAGRNVTEFLFARATIGSDVLDSVKAAIFTIIGEDKLNFYFNSSFLLNEYDINIGHKKKYLSLDWNPITTNNTVTKLMVSVRDITQLKQMENAAREQKRQLDIVSQLLNLSAEKYLAFEESTTRYVQANRKAIQSCSYKDMDIVTLLFRNMHTIKGNCRTFGFTYLSNTVHEAESTYSALKSLGCSPGDASWQPLLLLNDLALVEKDLAEYAHVYRTVLGRGNDSRTDRRSGFWMSKEMLGKIKTYVKNNKINEFDNYIARINAITFEQNLVDIIASLASIAAQLGKRTPLVKISADKIYIKDSTQEVMHDIFAHILRNCIDHGLETTEERIHASKRESGSIVINATLNQTALTVSVQDDGRGLNIPSLFKKGVQLGKWHQHETPDVADIAQLIFESGVSTKDAVSDISGRGIGLDAVKQFVEGQGGSVSLMLHRELASNQTFVPFTLILTLPAQLFFAA